MYPSIGGVCANLNIPGCLQSSGTDTTCSKCDDTYYLDADTKVCIKGITPNCFKYDPLNNPTSPTKCAICSPGFKLEATKFTCIELMNCEISDGTNTAVCTLCKPYFYLKTATKECLEPNTMIPYCRKY